MIAKGKSNVTPPIETLKPFDHNHKRRFPTIDKALSRFTQFPIKSPLNQIKDT